MRWTCTHLPLATDFNSAQKINLLCCQDPISALTRFFWHLFKSEHVRLVQYRAHARQDKGEEHGPNPPNGSWGIVKARPSPYGNGRLRLDLNHPPTAVGGIQARTTLL